MYFKKIDVIKKSDHSLCMWNEQNKVAGVRGNIIMNTSIPIHKIIKNTKLNKNNDKKNNAKKKTQKNKK
jgi:hypothetical protein